MRKISLIIVMLAFFAAGYAQNAPGRTPKTKVSDALALLPAPDAAEYGRLMEDLVSTGAEGVDMLTSMFDSPDNAPVSYALAGWSAYVSADGREQARKTFAEGICRALDTCNNSVIGSFYITLLQQCGRDESVDVLVRCAGFEQLNSPALKALASIGSEKAKAGIVEVMKKGAGSLTVVAQAVGDARIECPDVENNLIQWTGSGDKDLDKAVFYALSRMGGYASLDMLRAAAEDAAYTSDPTGATDCYILLIKRLADSGLTKEALAEANRLMKKAAAAGAEHSRLGALEIILSIEGAEAMPLVLKAMDDSDRNFRVKTLEAVVPFADDAVYAQLVKKLRTSKKTEAQVDLLEFLGGQRVKEALGDVLPLIGSENAELRDAAMWAATRIGGAEIPALLAGIIGGDASEDAMETAAECLGAYQGNVNDQVAAVVRNGKTSKGRVLALSLLSARGARDKADVVLAAAEDGNSEVKRTACASLARVVDAKDLPALYVLLEQDGGESVSSLQKAVVAAMSGMTPAGKLRAVQERMLQCGSKKARYYAVLAQTGAPDALSVICKGFDEGSAEEKTLALEALNLWTGNEALDKLYEIARTADGELADKALSYFVAHTASSDKTADQKRLLLSDALDIAKTGGQKSMILERLQHTGTFLAMTCAGEYLNDSDKQVRQAAATAVIQIALAHKEYYGPVVVFLLNRAASVNEDKDSSYQREEIRKHLASLPQNGGYVSLFNGQDLTGWKGLVENPIARAKMSAGELARKQVAADEIMRRDWHVEDGLLVFEGSGFDNICTEKQYGDFEMYVDWLLYAEGTEADAGIYLRGTPQVQMWDTARHNVGAQVGSGGLYNNTVNRSTPTKVADNRLGTWNTFYIKMVGERVTVVLNGEKVVDNVILENFWDRSLPIFPVEQIELQAHGTRVAYRNLYINELPRVEPIRLSEEEEKEGFGLLFDGVSMNQWTGNTRDYVAEEGTIVLYPGNGGGGNLYTKEEYGDFVFRFDFQLTPGANNGLGIRTPMEGDAAYVGMELQILDNEDPIYSQLEKYQYHGSVYGVIPAKRGFLKPVGEWNSQEVVVKGNRVKVTLNGEVILDGDIAEASKNGTMDGKDHPGLKNGKGHIGFLGHGSEVRFRNIRIKPL